MSQASSESGRTRVVVTVVLAVLIGAVGAFLLPVLIHEAKTPETTTFRAEIAFDVPAAGLPEAGVFHVFAARHDLHLSVEQPIPAGTDQAALLDLLASPVRAAGWGPEAQPTAVGHALSFPGVTTIGGAPGTPGVPMSISVGSRPGQALRLAIRLRRGAAVEPGRVRLALSARGAVQADAGAGAVATASETTDWTTSAAALPDLAARLGKAGWQVALEEDGALHLRALPDEAPPGSAILTVEYEGAVPTARDWSIDLVP